MSASGGALLARGATRVSLRGGLWLEHPDGALLLDAPPGARPLPAALAGVVLTSGRASALGGLWGVLDALAPTSAPLPLVAPLGDERPSALAEAWARTAPEPLPLDLDARRPGTFTLGPHVVTTVEVVGGERGRPIPAVGVRVRTPDATVVWVPACRPGTVVERLCSGADLAVLAVGPGPFAPGPDRARLAARGAAAVALVEAGPRDG